jgi:cathepsin F
LISNSSCGSCWAFSATGNIEGLVKIKTGKLIKLSEQNLLECDHTCVMYKGEKVCNNGCYGGLQDAAFNYIISNDGIDTNASYPYTGRVKQCHFNNQTIGAKIVSWKWLSTNEDKLAEQLMQYGPISVALNADTLFMYAGGVFTGAGCDVEDINHAVLLTGFGVENGAPVWYMKNSWSKHWGVNGYAYVLRGKNVCGIASEPLTAEI